MATVPLDSLKIDKSFIDGLESNGRSRTLVSAIINLAGNLGVRSVAEGVEHETQVTIHREMGCDLIQGYVIGHPEPPDQIAEVWLGASVAPLGSVEGQLEPELEPVAVAIPRLEHL